MRRFTLFHVALLFCMILGVGALVFWLFTKLQPAQGKTYYFFVEDTTGLPEGTEIKFRGLPVGQVNKVALDESRSTQSGTPWFRVDFQVNPQGERILGIWTFHRVTLGQETPVIGATVVVLTDGTMPGGKTPADRPLRVVQGGGDLTGELSDIGAGIRDLVSNANATVRSLRTSLDSRPETLGDDRAANLALVLQRDVYTLDDSSSEGAGRPTRVAAVLGNLSAAARSIEHAGEGIASATREDGPMDDAFAKIGTLTTDLDNPDKPMLSALTDLKKTTTSIRADFSKFGSLADSIKPSLDQGMANADQMLDTLKREPWRLVWKSTKDYAGAAPATVANPSASPRKSGTSAPAARRLSPGPSPAASNRH